LPTVSTFLSLINHSNGLSRNLNVDGLLWFAEFLLFTAFNNRQSLATVSFYNHREKTLMNKLMRFICKAFATLIVFSTAHSAMAQTPLSDRDSAGYDLSKYPTAFLKVYSPSQPYQPVYAWRTHARPSGQVGNWTQNGELIGYTDHIGLFQSLVPLSPYPGLCGRFRGEEFAVGSIYGSRSAPLNFDIYDSTTFGFGPDTSCDTRPAPAGRGNYLTP
jgi:hypothetical protein